MASKFLERVTELIKADVTQTTTNYASNLINVKNDAKAVAQTFQADTTEIVQKSQDIYKRMKSGRIVKDISNWFYGNASDAEAEYDKASSHGDEFDAGMKDEDDESSSSSSTPTLNIPSTAESSRQISAMYMIGAKQAEANMANAAEIVANLNTRSAEIIASINTVNQSVLAIGTKLDTISAKIQAMGEAAEKREITNKSLVNESGDITLTKLYETIKETNKIQNNMYYSMLKLGVSAIAGNSPEEAFSGLMDIVRDKVKVKGKSIDEWGNAFNELSGALIQRTLRGILDNDHVKKILGDTMGTGTRGQDYSEFRVNRYDEKAAIFDGMTRQSIVTIIPGYLKSIDEHLRGRTLNIDDYGNLTTDVQKQDQFMNVTKAAFGATGLSDSNVLRIKEKSAAQGNNISQEDIELAARALSAAYVMYMEGEGRTTLSAKEISVAGAQNLVKYAVDIFLVPARGNTSMYWTTACNQILFALEGDWLAREKFIKSVTQQSRAMQADAMEKAQSAKYGHLSGQITDNMVQTTFINEYGIKQEPTQPQPPPTINNTASVNPGGPSGPNPPTTPTVTTEASTTEMLAGKLNGILNSDVVATFTEQITKATGGKVEIKIDENGNVNIVSEGTGSPAPTPPTPAPATPTPETATDKMAASAENAEGGTSETSGTPSPTPAASNTNTAASGSGSTENKPHVLDQIREIPGNLKAAASAKVNEIADSVRDKVVDKANELKEIHAYNTTVKEFSDVENKEEVSDSDKILVQTVMQMAQTATSDGEVSNQDLDTIQKTLNQITDPNIKRKLQVSIIPMLNRVNTKNQNGDDTDVNASSPKGGIVGKVLFGIKTAFNVILKPIKSFLSMAWKGVKAFSKKLFSGVIKLFKSGAGDVISGGRAMKESLFGIKNEDGTRQDGLLQQLIVNPAKAIGGWAGGVLKNVGSTALNLGKAGITSISSRMRENAENPDSLVNRAKTRLGIAGETIAEGGEMAKQSITERMANLKDKFGQTEFGKGFMEAFNKKDIEAKQAKLKTPETMTDVNSDEIKNMVAGKADSIFSKIMDGISSIIEKMSGGEEENKEGEETKEGEENKEGENKSEEQAQQNQEQTQEQQSSDQGSSESSSQQSTATDVNGGSFSSDAQAAEGGEIGADDGGATPGLDMSAQQSPQATDVNAAQGAGAKAAGKNGGKLFNIGKLLGGMSSVLLGLGKMVLSIVMGMSGVKAIMTLIRKTLTKSLKPLNHIFKRIYKMLKPVVKELGKLVKRIVLAVEDILQNVLDTITPILDIIGPLIEDIMDLLDPLLNLVTDMIDVILKPIAVLLEGVVVPILRHIGNVLDFIFGVVQTGFGLLQKGYGYIIKGIGKVINAVVGVGGGGFIKAGDKLINTGNDNITMGTTKVTNAINDEIAMFKETFSGSEEEESTRGQVTFNQGTTPMNGSLLDGTITGNGNMASYGSYMNMDQRGCGPLTLSDALARRTGRNVDPTSLTAAMANGGLYNANKGTSVNGYIAAASGLGMGLRAGNVTNESLSMASSRNPITVLGSGTSFGTQQGNNHYVNVIGSSGSSVLVANPLTGRVTKESKTDIVNNSKMGLYGSGDLTLPDDLSDAMEELSEIANNIFSLFSFEGDGSVSSQVKKQQQADNYKKAKEALGQDDSGNWVIDSYETQARELFEQKSPRRKSESEEDYEKRWQKNKEKYLLRVAQKDADEAMENKGTSFMTTLKTFVSDLFSADEDVAEDTKNVTSVGAGGTAGTSATAEQFISLAQSDVGKHRSEVNCTGSTGGTDGDWCANYVSQVMKRSGYKGPFNLTVGYLLKAMKESSDWEEVDKNQADRGDVVFFDWQNPNPFDGSDSIAMSDPQRRWDHVGWIESCDGNGTWNCIEGNAGGAQSVTRQTQHNPYVDTIMRFVADRTSGGDLVGNSNKDKIWSFLVAPEATGGAGFSRAGAAGIMGNMQNESGFEPNNLEDKANDKFGITDEAYTAAVNNGSYSKEKFMHDHWDPNLTNNCGSGYGLVQFTWHTLKRDLYNYAMSHSKDISNLTDQLNYLKQSIVNDKSQSYYDSLKTVDNPYNAATEFMRIYEGCKNQGTEGPARGRNAQAIFDEYAGKAIPDSPFVSAVTNLVGPTQPSSLNNVNLNMYDEPIGPTLQTPPTFQVTNTQSYGIASASGSEVAMNTGDEVIFRLDMKGKTFIQGTSLKCTIGDWHYKYGPWKVASIHSGTGKYNLVSTVDSNIGIDGVPRSVLALYRKSAMIENGYKPAGLYGAGDQPLPEYVPVDMYGNGDIDTPTQSSNTLFNLISNAAGTSATSTTPAFVPYDANTELTRAEMINALSTMEFNVSAKRLESLVEQVIEKLDEKKANGSGKRSSQPNDMFNEQIPAQVSRLYS